jgi:hypothetical protein
VVADREGGRRIVMTHGAAPRGGLVRADRGVRTPPGAMTSGASMTTTVDAAIEAQSEVEAVKELEQRDPSGRYGRRDGRTRQEGRHPPNQRSPPTPSVGLKSRTCSASRRIPPPSPVTRASAGLPPRPATSCGAPAELTTGAPPRAIPGSPHHLCFPARGGVGLGGLGVSGAPERPRDEEQLEGKP